MNAKNYVKLVVVIVLIGVLAGVARADKLTLQEKLSRELKVKLTDVTIAGALETIGKKAGVKFVLSDDAEWKLPYGKATRLSVALDGPLAESMTQMLNMFFMRYSAGDQEITIYPRPELKHIVGRPNARQLELLRDLYTKPIEVYFVDKVQETVNKALAQQVLISPLEVQDSLNKSLRKLVGEKSKRVRESDGKYVSVIIMPGTDSQGNVPGEYVLATPVTIVQLLRDVTLIINNVRSNRTEWYIPRIDFAGQTPEIRVVRSGEVKSLQRQELIDISYKDKEIVEVLRDLADRAGYNLYIYPDAKLEGSRISASMQNVTAEQGMIRMADIANLNYEYRRHESLSVRGKKTDKKPVPRAKTKTAGRSGSGGYVGKISVPMDGGKYFIEFMLRESDLTEELKKVRSEKMKEILGKEEKNKPATQRTGTHGDIQKGRKG
jgi:hypothetical protein